MFTDDYFAEVAEIARRIDTAAVERMAHHIADIRGRAGRLFVLGVGGSAANSSHAVNDFRKLCDVEAYAAVDNVSELTARTNDEGWDSVFVEWLRASNARPEDGILVFSVGGGNAERRVSVNIVKAVDFAKEKGLSVLGIVGRDDGHTAAHADCVVVVPNVNDAHVTPHSEAYQSVIWHCLVSHPALKRAPTKW